MPLLQVTITGADESTDIGEMLAMSQVFPFVEWGILYSADGPARPRFPSIQWIRSLASVHRNAIGRLMNLSLHLCGRALENWLEHSFEPELAPWLVQELGAATVAAFPRMQLNFHGEAKRWQFAPTIRPLAGEQVIWQMDGVHDSRLVSRGQLNFSALFDRSHGAGITPAEWPAPIDGRYCGYAGGLGPHNIEIELPKIDAAAAGAPYWIDMETHVRTPDNSQLDLGKVFNVLRFCSRYVYVGPVGPRDAPPWKYLPAATAADQFPTAPNTTSLILPGK